jgi:molybdenum-dependent DNA-binding transcriptional regulator ModE
VIPDEDHALATNETFELLKKIDEAGSVETLLLGAGK